MKTTSTLSQERFLHRRADRGDAAPALARTLHERLNWRLDFLKLRSQQPVRRPVRDTTLRA